MCHVTAMTGCLSVDIETFGKAKEETRVDDFASHQQVSGENEYSPKTLLSDMA